MLAAVIQHGQGLGIFHNHFVKGGFVRHGMGVWSGKRRA
jgi:hypothetical protein